MFLLFVCSPNGLFPWRLLWDQDFRESHLFFLVYFLELGLLSRSLIHFQLTFVYAWELWFHYLFMYMHVANPFFPSTICWRSSPCSLYTLHPSVRNGLTRNQWLFSRFSILFYIDMNMLYQIVLKHKVLSVIWQKQIIKESYIIHETISSLQPFWKMFWRCL